MKFSILYLNYDPDHKLCSMVNESLHSIISNSTGNDYEIIILDRENIRKEINRGFRQARGEYIILVANDIIISDPLWLSKFAVPGTITGFILASSKYNTDIVDGSCFCMPKSIQDKIGEWDEGFTGYGWCDEDYFFRAKQIGIPFRKVDVSLRHLQSMTYSTYNLRNADDMKNNERLFAEKHNLKFDE